MSADITRVQRAHRAAAEAAYFIDQIANANGYASRRQLDPLVKAAAAALLRVIEITGDATEASDGG